MGYDVHRFTPNTVDDRYYSERTDRNIGWITQAEQDILRNSVVGIAGAGGMGGLLASILVRVGVGEIRISDCETFDVSNINRQFAATRGTVGKSKALETARMIREIADDTTVVVYPQGITEESAYHFVEGCHIICDEIEVLAIDARILLHRQSRTYGVNVFNCNTVGFSTNLFLYTPTSMTIEEATGVSYEEAQKLRNKAVCGDAESLTNIVHAMMRAVVPNLPEYRPTAVETDHMAFYRRFLQEKKVPIIATNPPMATGFLANRVLLHLLRNSGVPRAIVNTPEMPGYLTFDAAHMHAQVGTRGCI
jgi:molybdopterin/thiamine biosynthesis adenylyltransferase